MFHPGNKCNSETNVSYSLVIIWYESLVALRYRYVDIMKALTNIVLLSDKKDEVEDAAALKNIVVFLVVVL